jgi:cyclophilin family peptidyl-prolyl cis-trans isomerase
MVRVYIIYRLDGKHVVFGKVAEGMDVLNAIEACGWSSGKPKNKVIIADCGVLDEVKH